MTDRQLGTAVIGGSQAGLAVGYHLRQRGLPFAILDDNKRMGDAWRKRWDSLRLFTPRRYSGLPGMRFPGSPSSHPTKDETADYLEAYAREFELPVRTRKSAADERVAQRISSPREWKGPRCVDCDLVHRIQCEL